MLPQSIELVKQLIKDNPQDDFWIDGNNEILFDEIEEMVNRGGYDLILIKKGETKSNLIKNIFHEPTIDNRDMESTEVNGIEINVWDVLENLIENNVVDGSKCNQLISKLKDLHDEIEYIQEEIVDPDELDKKVILNELESKDYWDEDGLELIKKFYTGEVGES